MARPAATLTHEWIWHAIDTLASRRGLSPSGLARLAGLDPTAFNRSKRFTPEGRPRWPSTESLSRILEATATSLDEFAAIDVAPALRAAASNQERPAEEPASPAASGHGEAPDAAVATGQRRAAVER